MPFVKKRALKCALTMNRTLGVRGMSSLNLSYIIEITRRDFVERFAGSILGSVWAVIWPMINLFIYIMNFTGRYGCSLFCITFNSCWRWGLG